jgi:hypothetical protein
VLVPPTSATRESSSAACGHGVPRVRGFRADRPLWREPSSCIPGLPLAMRGHPSGRLASAPAPREHFADRRAATCTPGRRRTRETVARRCSAGSWRETAQRPRLKERRCRLRKADRKGNGRPHCGGLRPAGLDGPGRLCHDHLALPEEGPLMSAP